MSEPIPDEALRSVGELLAFEGHSVSIVVMGGIRSAERDVEEGS